MNSFRVPTLDLGFVDQDPDVATSNSKQAQTLEIFSSREGPGSLSCSNLQSGRGKYESKRSTIEPSNPLPPKLKELYNRYSTLLQSKQYKSHKSVELVLEKKRRYKILETVLLDQLSRAVVCSAEVEDEPCKKLPNSQHAAGHFAREQARTRPTEKFFSDIVRFDARILTRSSSSAVRDLTGFFMNSDLSLTVYELKQFGKSTKALSFICRGKYGFIQGHKTGQMYTLADIYPGSNLEFLSANQQSLSNHLQRESVLKLRVTDVDHTAKQAIVLSDIRPSHLHDAYVLYHLPITTLDIDHQFNLLFIQSFCQRTLKGRGVKTMLGMWNYCVLHDVEDSGLLPRYDLEKMLLNFHIEPETTMIDILLVDLDHDKTGLLDYCEFLRRVLGEMTEARKSLVRKVFKKMDHRHSGFIAAEDLAKFYNSGNPSDEGDGCPSLADFLEQLQNGDQISYRNFEIYYEGLSIDIESDDEFYAGICQTWRV